MTPKGDWLEGKLGGGLAPVAAPAELERRVFGSEVGGKGLAKFVWALGACAGVVMIGAVLRWETARPVAAVDFLKRGGLEFASSDAGAVRAWVEQRVPLDVAMKPSNGIAVRGASILTGGTAAVAFEVNGKPAALLVKPAAAGAPGGHTEMREEVEDGVRVGTWNMHGQTFTLASASPAAFAGACHLCHEEERSPASF